MKIVIIGFGVVGQATKEALAVAEEQASRQCADRLPSGCARQRVRVGHRHGQDRH